MMKRGELMVLCVKAIPIHQRAIFNFSRIQAWPSVIKVDNKQSFSIVNHIPRICASMKNADFVEAGITGLNCLFQATDVRRHALTRSEERRVGKECRSRWS